LFFRVEGLGDITPAASINDFNYFFRLSFCPRTAERLTDLLSTSLQIMVCITSADNQVMETTYARHVYMAAAVFWGYRFVEAISFAGDSPIVDMNLLHEVIEIDEEDEDARAGRPQHLQLPRRKSSKNKPTDRKLKKQRRIDAESFSTVIYKDMSTAMSRDASKVVKE